MPSTLWIHALGTVGAVMLLLSYFLVSQKRLQGDSMTFQLLNIVGSVLLAINTGFFHAWPSMVLNIVWVAVGVSVIRKVKRIPEGQ